MTNLAGKMVSVPDIAGPIAMGGADEELLSISEMSETFGVTLRTLRFYEEKGLLNPVRRGARRFYRARDAGRMRVILQAKKIGLTLGEIRKVIAIIEGNAPRFEQLQQLREICREQNDLLQEQQTQVNEQLAEMTSIMESLDTLIEVNGKRPG